jgi:hypothetical protein
MIYETGSTFTFARSPYSEPVFLQLVARMDGKDGPATDIPLGHVPSPPGAPKESIQEVVENIQYVANLTL